MTPPIISFIVFVILSNLLLGNVDGQSAQSGDSSTMFLALEDLSKAVERLEAKIESQTITLSNLEAKVELKVKNLETKVEMMQGRILRDLEALLGKMEANVKELVTKEAGQEPIAYSPTNGDIVAPEGNDVEILCVIRGTPLPKIKWTKENGSLESDRVAIENDGKVLRIKNARLNDEGSYDCVAANGVGTPATQSVRLQVYDPSQGCHRIIKSDKGNLVIKSLSSGCLWLIKLQNTTGFRVELDPFMTEPITFISEPNSSNSNVQYILGSKIASHAFAGKILAIVVPPGRERMTLSWTGLDVDDSGVSSSIKFVNDLEGTLEWESQHDGTDKIFWAIDLESNGELNWTLNTTFRSQDQESPCENISLSVVQIRPDGTISEVQRNCDGSSEGSLKLEISSQVLVLGHFKSLETSITKLWVSWTHHDELMDKNVDGIVAGSDDGAFVIPFNSVPTKVVPEGFIYGMTYNWNLRRIYYLKSGVGIMRSNLNGSESEILLSDTSSSLYGMTIEPASGNLYLGNRSSRTIRVCDNNAKKCSTIANSNDSSDVIDVAVHLSKGLLFWSIGDGKIVRANLDGSNAIVLLERGVRGLDVDEHEDRLYWSSLNNTIGSCDMNGQDIREMPIIKRMIWDVAIDNDKVYYCTWDTDAVHVTSKLGSNSRMVAQLMNDVNHVALFGTRVSNRPRNPCAEAKCAHLCVLVTRWSHRCTCLDGQVLNADGKTCKV